MVDEIEPNELLCTVVDILNSEGQWVVSRIHLVLPSRVLQQIQSYKRHLDPCEIVAYIWKENADGIVTARSLYNFLTSKDESRDSRKWTWVWKLTCPQKIRFLVRLLLHERLPVNGYRSHIGISCSSLYDRCQDEEETVFHLLRDYPSSCQVWESVVVF